MRVPRSIALLGVATMVAVLGGCGTTRTEPPPPPASAPALDPDLAPEVAHAIAMRSDLGLRTDPAYVESVHAARDSIRSEFGFLVTPEEAAALERRFAAQDELGALAAYGAEHVDTFGGLYIDQASGGDVVLLFTGGVERHARVASALAPDGVTVRVREVDFTETELQELLDELDFDALGPNVQMVEAGVDVIRNVVTLTVKTDDEGFEGRTEAEHGGRLDVNVHPMPGPWHNAESGDGWRLVAAGETSNVEAYTVRAATDDAAWAEMWEAIGLEQERPHVDLGAEVAVSFGHGIGSGCRELRLDDVVIDGDVVYGVTSDPLSPRACTTDLAAAAVFVVVVSRDALPAAGFTLRLAEQTTTCADCGFSEQIEVPLP
jgi:hypothetical protein